MYRGPLFKKKKKTRLLKLLSNNKLKQNMLVLCMMTSNCNASKTSIVYALN